MKTHKILLLAAVGFLVLVFTGCGPSKDELAVKERQRLELEKQAERDAAKGNKAITDMNKKMFSRMNASSPGATAAGTPPAQPAPETKKP